MEPEVKQPEVKQPEQTIVTPEAKQPESKVEKTIDYEKQYKAAQKELEKIKADQVAKEQAEMESKKQFEELYGAKKKEIETITPELERLRAFENDYKTKLLSKLDEADRDEFASLSIKQLEKLVEKLSATSTIEKPLGAGSSRQPQTSQSEIENYAKTIANGKITDIEQHKKIMEKINNNGVPVQIIKR
ncbi:MAG: hypothetical protein ABFC34_13950 [Methanobacterium sp.]